MKNQYSAKKLKEFKSILTKKLERAKEELQTVKEEFKGNENGIGREPLKLYESGDDCMLQEELGRRIYKQQKYILELESALIRIENKCYGICRVTGKLIPEERLRAVPHATMSIDAKLKQNI